MSLDFLRIAVEEKPKDKVEIRPKFIITKSSDLMIRGGDFYAIWVEDKGCWSTEEDDAIRLIDREVKSFYEEYKKTTDCSVYASYMWDASSGMIDSWHKYCQKQMRDNYHMLDETLIFSNMETNKTDYSSKRLPYPLEPGDCNAWNKLVSTLYSEEERTKIEWAIGCIVSGDSKHVQKFMVMYGAAGTGKSTILNIIQKLFKGYYSVFDAKALGSSSNVFALEAFKSNPLVAIQHDGDLSKIEDNTRLNSLVSHEYMTVNEKFKSTYTSNFKAFLFMGTNKPVKITDAKSGLIRRLIDVSPSGNKLKPNDYKETMNRINFELGAIANHCLEVYLENPGRYDDYVPVHMLGASNDFYNFVIDSYSVFKKENGTTLKAAWEMYKTYCEEAKVPYAMSQRVFKEELRNYFWKFDDRYLDSDEGIIRNYYSGFRTDIFERDMENKKPEKEESDVWLKFDSTESIFDQTCADYPAQYANVEGTPSRKWENVKTKLKDLITSRIHYVKVPENHIVIDFDIPDENGNKCFEKNFIEACKWPPTYAELSKSGEGIHLHYIYTGDPAKLSRLHSDHIEVKVFNGKSSVRRKLTKCNALAIATISSGLKLKEGKKMINSEVVQSEKGLRTLIQKNLRKEIHPATKPSIDFIYKILEDAYVSGLHYDVTDLRNDVFIFAAQSTNQSDYCMRLANKMKFKSDESSDAIETDEKLLIFYDIEVFPNLFLVNWKFEGKEKPVVRMINPTPEEIEELTRFNLIGFNNRRYDNHILYARLMGYSNEELFKLSQRIINDQDRNAFFGEAYNLSYTDVYDFASAGNKMSLKKWEIKLGIHHQELGLPWDQPVPKEMWIKVAEYCDNDVIATEAVFNHLKGDWIARQILADLAEMSVNDTTNTLTTRIIFGKERHPQSEFCYRNMAEPVHELDDEVRKFLEEACPEMMSELHGEEKSLLPYFPGYKYEFGKSTYRDEEVGEGGYVYAEPGIYGNVALLDVASMHPHSTIAECLFGPRFTRIFKEIVDGRVDIKHEAWDEINDILGGKLTPYVEKVKNGELTSKELANALKTAINSVYGLTAAKFENAFRDNRNVDNIVAKRGALFMVDLKHEVQERGFTVAHIKTDSIKIPDATPDIIQFVMDFGKKYGYTFEHEATYDRMCLVNDAVYIAKYKDADECENLYGYAPGDNKKKGNTWSATGKQFAVPYVFKNLFSHEPIELSDLSETMSVSTALYLDRNEQLPEGEHNRLFIGKVGSFTPILPGRNGGELVREGRDSEGNVKYDSATGAKGYRWLETEMVRELKKEEDIDRSYYDRLVDNAVDAISQYGDFEWFISDDPYIPEERPPWE